MQQQLAMQEVARLEAIVRTEGGSRAFAALAQAQRQAGRPEEAERVAREGLRRHPDQVAGRVALGLALLDQGREGEARSELERVLDTVPDHAVAHAAMPGLPADSPEPIADAVVLEGVADSELEQAFEVAEAQRDEMIDADGVAAATVRALENESDAELEDDSTFATRTMAQLLQEQGHEAEAQRIRESLPAEVEVTEGTRERVLDTLEGWLDNLRKGRR